MGLLEMLLLHADEVVPSEQLLEALWGEEPPATADHAVEVYVSRLRRALGDERIVTALAWLRLRLAEGDVLDLDRFLALTDRAATAIREGRPMDATVALHRRVRSGAARRCPSSSGSSAGRAEMTPARRAPDVRYRVTDSTRGLPRARPTSCYPSSSAWSPHIPSGSGSARS